MYNKKYMISLFKFLDQPDTLPFKSLNLPKYYFESFLEERTPENLIEAGKVFKSIYPNGPKISKTTLPDQILTVSERMEYVSKQIKNQFQYEK
jgi:hypothetical protein